MTDFQIPLRGAHNPSSERAGTTPGSFALKADIGGPLMFASPDTPGMPAPSDRTAWDFLPDGWRTELIDRENANAASFQKGRGEVVFAHADEPIYDPQGRVHTMCHAVKDKWCVFGCMLSAGGSLQWARNHLAQDLVAAAKKKKVDPYELIIEEARHAPPGCEARSSRSAASSRIWRIVTSSPCCQGEAAPRMSACKKR